MWHDNVHVFKAMWEAEAIMPSQNLNRHRHDGKELNCSKWKSFWFSSKLKGVLLADSLSESKTLFILVHRNEIGWRCELLSGVEEREQTLGRCHLSSRFTISRHGLAYPTAESGSIDPSNVPQHKPLIYIKI